MSKTQPVVTDGVAWYVGWSLCPLDMVVCPAKTAEMM